MTTRAILLLLLPSLFFAPVMTLGSPQAGEVCATTCEATTTKVYVRTGDGRCTHAYTYPCSPFRCDSQKKTCSNRCQNKDECSPGYVCDIPTRTCHPPAMEFKCIDTKTALRPDGVVTDCKPYRCSLGVCHRSCKDDTNCTDGFRCNKRNRCVRYIVGENEL